MPAIRIAVVGIGKIARDQHLPVLAADAAFHVAAAVSRHARLDDVPVFADLEALRAHGPSVDAVALCTPPQGRHQQARQALEAGWHVLLEKPPAATLGEFEDLVALAAAKGRTLYATWHSAHAPAVAPAAAWAGNRRLRRIRITWKEDVRRWHPGQQWIWQAGGLGVFDPGINALSILVRLVPGNLFVCSADLSFPANRDTPIAARLGLETADGLVVDADFDWRQTGDQTWEIVLEAEGGETLSLLDGGARLSTGLPAGAALVSEYASIYRRFAELVHGGRCETDGRPFRIVADAFLAGRRLTVAPFED